MVRRKILCLLIIIVIHLLCRTFFLKDEAGRKNSTVTHGEITGKVSEVIKHYWVLASPKNRIAKLLKDYQFQHKNKNMK